MFKYIYVYIYIYIYIYRQKFNFIMYIFCKVHFYSEKKYVLHYIYVFFYLICNQSFHKNIEILSIRTYIYIIFVTLRKNISVTKCLVQYH